MNQQYDESDLDFELDSDGDDIDAVSSTEDVEVHTEELAHRQRQITARIQISRPVEQVWQVLTAYDTLADFIPNLAISRRLAHPNGGIRLEQVGTQRLLRFNFSARVVLDLEEKFPHEIHFDLVEGDLKAYSGKWLLEPHFARESPSTNLCYVVRVLPKRTMPVAIVERRLRQDLRSNLLAIRHRVEELYAAGRSDI